MNKSELKSALERLNVYPAAYSLDGGLPNERYVLDSESSSQWAVYYSERGQKTGKKLFDSESAACQYLYQQILTDATTRKK